MVMIAWAITFLLIAIFVALFGLVAVGPVGLILAAVFFGVFVWLLVEHLRNRSSGPRA